MYGGLRVQTLFRDFRFLDLSSRRLSFTGHLYLRTYWTAEVINGLVGGLITGCVWPVVERRLYLMSAVFLVWGTRRENKIVERRE